MKSTIITHARRFAGAILLAAGFGCGSARAAAFPEPEVILYGQVRSNAGGGAGTILTSGTLTWTLVPPAGSPVVVTTKLAAYPNGMSYVLKIPAEKLVSGTVVSPNTLEASFADKTYDRSGVVVNGTSYLINFPSTAGKNSLVYGELLRGKIERVDLALVATGALDSDGDGMSDDFENLYAADGLNPNNPGDAGGDIDGDGQSNLAEFLAGTDPNGFDYLTWSALPSTGLALAERSKTFDKDGDGMTNWLEFAIGGKASISDRSHGASVLQPSFVEVAGKRYLSLTFSKPSARRLGVIYHIETSKQLGSNWTRASNGTVVVMQNSATTLRARESTEAGQRGFLRLAADEE